MTRIDSDGNTKDTIKDKGIITDYDNDDMYINVRSNIIGIEEYYEKNKNTLKITTAKAAVTATIMTITTNTVAIKTKVNDDNNDVGSYDNEVTKNQCEYKVKIKEFDG